MTSTNTSQNQSKGSSVSDTRTRAGRGYDTQHGDILHFTAKTWWSDTSKMLWNHYYKDGKKRGGRQPHQATGPLHCSRMGARWHSCWWLVWSVVLWVSPVPRIVGIISHFWCRWQGDSLETWRAAMWWLLLQLSTVFLHLDPALELTTSVHDYVQC